ncbi:MAG TPA: hypothetical protein VI316_00540 [Candidatus Dormibacteraeota bacterium]
MRAGSDGLLETAERMVGQIEALVEEIAQLRRDNEALQGELRDAVSLLEQASSALGGGAPGGRRRRGRSATAARGRAAKRAAPTPRAARGRPAGRTRATPASVTPDVVRGAIGKLGVATAAEIAAEISRHAGAKVNGRAIRFLAEQAGAQIEVVDGQRRYRL